MKLFGITFSIVSLAFAAIAGTPTYKMTLTEGAIVGGSELKPGDYKVEVNGDKATISAGKVSVQAPVKVETGAEKFKYTSVECTTKNGKTVLDDIRLGGTTTKLVFLPNNQTAP